MNQLYQQTCGKQQLSLRSCRDCGQVHLKTGEAKQSFARQEFDDFTAAVVNVHCSGWWKPKSRAPLRFAAARTNRILTGETIA